MVIILPPNRLLMLLLVVLIVRLRVDVLRVHRLDLCGLDGLRLLHDALAHAGIPICRSKHCVGGRNGISRGGSTGAFFDGMIEGITPHLLRLNLDGHLHKITGGRDDSLRGLGALDGRR